MTTLWTIVQHSAFGYKGDTTFRRSLETRAVSKKKDQDAVLKAGGVLFDTWQEADEFETAETSKDFDFVPVAPGTFADLQIDGLKVYRPATPQLRWSGLEHDAEEAVIGVPGDNVHFFLTHHPTCYRRGPFRLTIEVCGGPNHDRWGCFDEADQPVRNYHDRDVAKAEAQRIANVLWKDRWKR